ncbi:hypothetical protein [Halocatena marina]|uniref:hypothetical protein n=1 Tax=Halocatena marina TaxID=2934937 RepID=UPI00200E013B|nr:hypothetical protein [Halocatena marina]
MTTTERVLWVGGHGTFLLLVLAGIAFVSGYWAIFIALGPAACLLVFDAHNSDNTPTVVIISYVAALVVGWVTYTTIAPGIAPTTIKPMSESGLRVIGSGLVAFAVTAGTIFVLHTQQPMAYVAALTAAIGGLPTIQSLALSIIAVLLLAGIQAVRRRYGPEFATSPELLNNHTFET